MAGSTPSIHDVFYVVGLHAQHICHRFGGACLRVFVTDTAAQFFGQLGLRAVPRLLRRCSPAAILRAVWAVVVDSVKGQPKRFCCEVSDKISDIMPTVADKNTATPVPLVLRIRRVVASLHHGVPCWVQRVVPQPVLCVGNRGLFDPFRSGLNYGRVAMLVPSQVMLSAHLPSKHRVCTLGLGASIHTPSITGKRTYEKSKGVAAK